MKLHMLSIIPIELFTKTRAKQVEMNLLKNKKIFASDNDIANVFRDISGKTANFYAFSPIFGNDIYVAFYESSLCIYIEKKTDEWELSMESVANELVARNTYHKKIISNLEKSPAYTVMKELFSILPLSEYGDVKINYVFSFYIVECDKEQRNDENLKLLAEPSLIDLDDMGSTQYDEEREIENEIKSYYLNSLSDVDISSNANTYITWATIVSTSNTSWVNKTKSLLVALECRLQIIWNRCYSVSKYIDSVFESRNKPKEIDELYWDFMKTLDDAKSVLSSTYSSRADKLFSAMISTSKIDGEINRLEQKINLLEKYIEQHNVKLNNKYQKTIELLLFITALASLTQVFFPLPMSFLPETGEYIVMGVLSFVGILAIYKSR